MMLHAIATYPDSSVLVYISVLLVPRDRWCYSQQRHHLICWRRDWQLNVANYWRARDLNIMHRQQNSIPYYFFSKTGIFCTYVSSWVWSYNFGPYETALSQQTMIIPEAWTPVKWCELIYSKASCRALLAIQA